MRLMGGACVAALPSLLLLQLLIASCTAAVVSVGYRADQRTYLLRTTPEISNFHFIDGATVSIEHGYSRGHDMLYLNYDGIFSLESRFDSELGVLFITGFATTSEYAVAVRGVQFLTSDDEGHPRQITWTFGRDTFYFSSTRHFYTYINKPSTWQQARTACKSSTFMGIKGYLATPSSDAEHSQLGLKASAPYWIGGFADETRLWTWAAGPEAGHAFWQGNSVFHGGWALPALTFSPWNHFEPTAGGSYLYLNHSSGPQTGSWGAARADDSAIVKGYVCEYGGLLSDTVEDEDEAKTYFGTAIAYFDCSLYTQQAQCNGQRHNGCGWTLRNQRFSCNQDRCLEHFTSSSCIADPHCAWNTEREVPVCVFHRCGYLSGASSCSADATCVARINPQNSAHHCFDKMCHEMLSACDCAQMHRCAWRHERCGRETAMNCTAMDVIYVVDDSLRAHERYGGHPDGFLAIAEELRSSEPFLTGTSPENLLSNETFGQRIALLRFGGATGSGPGQAALTGSFSQFSESADILINGSAPGTQRVLSPTLDAVADTLSSAANVTERKVVVVIISAGSIDDAATANVSALTSFGVSVFGVALRPTPLSSPSSRAALASLQALIARLPASNPPPISLEVDEVKEFVIDELCRSLTWNYEGIRPSRADPTSRDAFVLRPELCSSNHSRNSCLQNPMCAWDHASQTCNNTHCLRHCDKTSCRSDPMCINTTYPETPMVCVALCATLNSSQCGRSHRDWGANTCRWSGAQDFCEPVACYGNPAEVSCNADPAGCWWGSAWTQPQCRGHHGSWGGSYCGHLNELQCAMDSTCIWNVERSPGYCDNRPCYEFNRDGVVNPHTRCSGDARCVWQTWVENGQQFVCVPNACGAKRTSCECMVTRGCIWKNDQCFQARYAQCPKIDVAFAVEATPRTLARYGRFRRLFLGMTQAIRDWSYYVPISAGADIPGFRFQMVAYSRTEASGGALGVPEWWGSGGNFTNTREQWLGYGRDLDWISFNGTSYGTGVETVALKPALDHLIESYRNSESHGRRIRTLFIAGISPITDGEELRASIGDLEALGVKVFVNAVRDLAESNLDELRAVEFMKPLASHPTDLFFSHSTVEEWQAHLDDLCNPLSPIGTMLNLTMDGQLPCDWLDSELQCNLQASCLWNPHTTATCSNAGGCPNLNCRALPPSLQRYYTCENCRIDSGELDCSRSYNTTRRAGKCEPSPCTQYCGEGPCETEGPDRPLCQFNQVTHICERKVCLYSDIASCNADHQCIYSEIDFKCHQSVCGKFRSPESCAAHVWIQGNGSAYNPCRWLDEGVSRPYCEETRCTLMQETTCRESSKSATPMCEWDDNRIGYRCQLRNCTWFDRLSCQLDLKCYWNPTTHRCQTAPADCVLSDYGHWAQCSAGCGSAWTMKQRAILSFPRSEEGGLSCATVAAKGCDPPNASAVENCDGSQNESSITVVRNCQWDGPWVPPFAGRATSSWPSDCAAHCSTFLTRAECMIVNDCHWRSGVCEPTPELGCVILSELACRESEVCVFDEELHVCVPAMTQCQHLNETYCVAHSDHCSWYPSGAASRGYALQFGISHHAVQLFNPGQQDIRPLHDLHIPSADSIDGAVVIIEGNYQRGKDVLLFASTATLQGLWHEHSGALEIQGSASISSFVDALRSVRFTTTSTNVAPRRITWGLGEKFLYSSATGHHYKAFSEPFSFYDTVESTCSNMVIMGLRGYLATITSAAENDFLASKLLQEGWVSGKFDTTEQWVYTSGPEKDSVFWSGGPPSEGGAAVGEAYTNWRDGNPLVTFPENDGLLLNWAGGWESRQVQDIGIPGYICEFGGLSGVDAPPSYPIGGAVMIGIGGCVARPCAWHTNEDQCWADIECSWHAGGCHHGCHSLATQHECLEAGSTCSWNADVYPAECEDTFTRAPTPMPSTSAPPPPPNPETPPPTTSPETTGTETSTDKAATATQVPMETSDSTASSETGSDEPQSTFAPPPTATSITEPTAFPTASPTDDTSDPTLAPKPAPGRCNVNVSAVTGGAIVNIETINDILFRHNIIRLSVTPSAVHMPLLRWSDELSDGAYEYISACPGMVHSPPETRAHRFGWRSIGENIGAGARNESRFAWNTIIPMWGEEGSFFTYVDSCPGTFASCGNCNPQGMFNSCGHYTQVVWANTTEVGCAYKYCANDPEQLFHYYICWYAAVGNVWHQPPYIAGERDADQCTLEELSGKGDDELVTTATPATTTDGDHDASSSTPADLTTAPPAVGNETDPETVTTATSAEVTDHATPTNHPQDPTSPQTALDNVTTTALSPTDDTPPTTAALPSTTTAPDATTTAPPSRTPSPPSTSPPPHTAEPEAEYVVVSGSITLGGNNFTDAMTSNRSRVEEAARHDIARLLDVHNSSVNVSLRVSTDGRNMTVSFKVSTPSADAASQLVDRVQHLLDDPATATEAAGNFTETLSAYASAGGDVESFRVLAASAAVDDTGGPSAPDDGGGQGGLGVGLIVGIVIGVSLLVTLVVGGALHHRRRRGARASARADAHEQLKKICAMEQELLDAPGLDVLEREMLGDHSSNSSDRPFQPLPACDL